MPTWLNGPNPFGRRSESFPPPYGRFSRLYIPESYFASSSSNDAQNTSTDVGQLQQQVKDLNDQIALLSTLALFELTVIFALLVQ